MTNCCYPAMMTDRVVPPIHFLQHPHGTRNPDCEGMSTRDAPTLPTGEGECAWFTGGSSQSHDIDATRVLRDHTLPSSSIRSQQSAIDEGNTGNISSSLIDASLTRKTKSTSLSDVPQESIKTILQATKFDCA
ncbi:hypothetical protein C9890_0471 [Perkinsus sp. BL_2016]|nr:hypothetical protein C9890_0471 [Perkinsus sp. BL_2016]